MSSNWSGDTARRRRGDRRDEWLAAGLEDLGYGDINGIEAAVREYPSRRNKTIVGPSFQRR
jgi:hypothetical protein